MERLGVIYFDDKSLVYFGENTVFDGKSLVNSDDIIAELYDCVLNSKCKLVNFYNGESRYLLNLDKLLFIKEYTTD